MHNVIARVRDSIVTCRPLHGHHSRRSHDDAAHGCAALPTFRTPPCLVVHKTIRCYTRGARRRSTGEPGALSRHRCEQTSEKKRGKNAENYNHVERNKSVHRWQNKLNNITSCALHQRRSVLQFYRVAAPTYRA